MQGDESVASSPGPLFPYTDGCFPGSYIRSESLSITNTHSMSRWRVDNAIYSATLHLADSIPVVEREKLIEIRQRLSAAIKEQNRDYTEEEKAMLRFAYDEHIEKYLQAGNGECVLARPDAAQELERVLEHDNGTSYALHAWTIMPNHLHVIFQTAEAVLLEDVVKTWKRVSAHKINRVMNRHGDVWMDGTYTRIIRTAEEYRNQLSYLWANPEVACLNSGYRRKRYVTW